MKISFAILLTVLLLTPLGAAQQNRPVVANAGSDRTIYTQEATATVTLDGSASVAPEGSQLIFSWSGPGLDGAFGPVVTLALDPGTHTFSLFASDKSSSDTDTVAVTVISDTTAPRVTAPDDIWIAATQNDGARAIDSDRLKDFIEGGQASDVDATITALFTPAPPTFRQTPQITGAPVHNDTLIPMGTHVVTFRFTDSAGNLGTANTNLTVFDLRDEDLFVGVPFAGSTGTVKQIRGGTIMDWCDAVSPDFMPDFFETPNDIIVDSQGRVVVLAHLRRPAGWGLFRCNAPGQPIEKLMFLPEMSVTDQHSNYPSLPQDLRQRTEQAFGLHLAREKQLVIDDNVNNGEPRLVTDDSYVFLTKQGGTPCGEGCGPTRSLQYFVRADRWQDGPEPMDHSGATDMTNSKGDTYSVSGAGLRREFNPLQISLQATIFDTTFTLDVFAFGGIFDIVDGIGGQRVIRDDTRKQDAPGVNCQPQPPYSSLQPDMAAHPNAYQPLGGATQVAVDTGGLELTLGGSGSSVDGAYMTNVSKVLMDADPTNDIDGHYIHDFICVVYKKLGFTSINNQQNVFQPRSVRRLSAVKQGLVGTALGGFTADVIRIKEGGDETLATFPAGPLVGIGGFPPMAGTSTAAVVLIRLDSPIDALLIDAAGRRLGVENGVPVNDFGINGFDSGPGEPRVFAIKDVNPGDFRLRSVGTGTGPYTIHVYSMKLDQPAGQHVLMRGEAMPGGLGAHDFTLAADGSVIFVNQTPIANAGSDQTVDAAGPAGAQVALDGSQSSDPDGDSLSYLWSGPFGQAAGRATTPTIPPGTHVLTLRVADGKGGVAEDRVTITVNRSLIDTDGDGVLDDVDNCPNDVNANQADFDGDAAGDVCDADDDNDGVPDTIDAFPFNAAEQFDTDGDAIGNNADADDDGDAQSDVDEVACGSDPLNALSKSADNESDNVPDCVDIDDDNDGVPDTTDNCPTAANVDQADSDLDGVGNSCDPTPGHLLELVFSSNRDGNSEIYGRKADGTELRLTNYSSADLDPALSPDRTRIIFTSTRTGNGDVYVMNADGTNVTRLTFDMAIDGFANWSPDGAKIVFASSRTGNGDIYVMNADGSETLRLTSHAAIDATPSWSPDGAAIAFSSTRTGNGDIYVMKADGSAPQQVTAHWAIDLFPSWSPNGDRIAFASSRTGLSDIYSMNANGTGLLRLTSHSAIDSEPAWAASGHIVFSTRRDGNFEIYVMNGDGTAPTRLTINSAGDFSPHR